MDYANEQLEAELHPRSDGRTRRVSERRALHPLGNAQRRNREQEEQANINVRQNQRNDLAGIHNDATEWNDHDSRQRGHQRNDRSHYEIEFIDVSGNDVLFEEELDRVGERLEEAERPDPVRSAAILDQRAAAATPSASLIPMDPATSVR